MKLNQAHSGYLEQYLNLGYIGVAFIGVIMLSGLLKVRKHLDVDPPAAMLRLCFIVTAVLYNYTEAAFYGINNMWLLLLLGTIDISGRGAKRTKTSTAWQQKVLLHPYDSRFSPAHTGRTVFTIGLRTARGLACDWPASKLPYGVRQLWRHILLSTVSRKRRESPCSWSLLP